MKKILLTLSFLLISMPTFAQDIQTTHQEEGYGYEFDDDPLNAGGFGANDMTIKVRPRAARTTLIRPRTSFIQEMLKSVENI